MKNTLLLASAISGILLCLSTPSLAVHCDDIFLTSSCGVTKAACEEATTCRHAVIAGWSTDRCMSAGGAAQGMISAECQDCNSRCAAPSALGWLDGTWQGTGEQNDNSSWSIHLIARSDKYSISYPSLSCSGEWILNNASKGVATFTEQIINDPGKQCQSGGTITIGILSVTQVQYHWSFGEAQAGGTLTKVD